MLYGSIGITSTSRAKSFVSIDEINVTRCNARSVLQVILFARYHDIAVVFNPICKKRKKKIVSMKSFLSMVSSSAKLHLHHHHSASSFIERSDFFWFVACVRRIRKRRWLRCLNISRIFHQIDLGWWWCFWWWRSWWWTIKVSEFREE